MNHLSPRDLAKVKRMCDIILGHSPSLQPELASLAFDLAHHPDLLGIPSPSPMAPRAFFDDPLV